MVTVIRKKPLKDVFLAGLSTLVGKKAFLERLFPMLLVWLCVAKGRWLAYALRGPWCLLQCLEALAQRFGAQFGHALLAEDAEQTDGDERYGEQLAHVEKHARLEVDLYVLGVFDEEAEREDERQTESEIESCAHLLAMLTVNREDDGEDDEVGYGLIQLSGMAWIGVYTLEDKGPGHIGHVADNLRVHEVSYSDECRCDARHHTKIV